MELKKTEFINEDLLLFSIAKFLKTINKIKYIRLYSSKFKVLYQSSILGIILLGNEKLILNFF